jgi:outer membrane cobalamin receptor
MPTSVRVMKTVVLLVLMAALFLAIPGTATAQQRIPQTGKIDSIGMKPSQSPADSAAQASKDSTGKSGGKDSLHVAPDTLGRMSTPSLVGTLDRSLDSTHYLTRENIHFIDYQYLGDILETFPGVYIRNLSSPGQYYQINVRGQDWRGVAVLQDGRLLNDPASGIYNLFQYSTEYADRVELVTGPRAFLYGVNSTAGAVNVLTRNYNSNRAFTKLNYFQGAYGYASTDGTFSQNVSRKINLTLGFQYQGFDGRFLNSLDDSWSGRAKVRYNVSKDLNIILSEYLTSSKTDLNGGIDLSRTLGLGRDPFGVQATVKNAESYEKIARNDVDLSVVGTFLGDSTNVSTLSLYYSNNFRQYRDEENRYTPSNGIFIMSDHTSSWMGATFSQNFDTELQRFSMGLNFELRQIEGSPNLGRHRNTIGSVWGKEELLLGRFLTVAGYGRLDSYLGNRYAGAGADATLHLGPGISLFGGLSVSHRMPNYMELYWTDSTVTRPRAPSAEQHRTVELGAEIADTSGSSLRVAYFHRTVNDPIRFIPAAGTYAFPTFAIENGANIATNGIEARFRLRLWVLSLEGVGTYLLQSEGGTKLQDLPKFALSGGVYYWNKPLENRLELKAGFRGRYQSGQSGALLNPEVIAYVPNSGTQIGYASTVDFYLIAHVGDAYVHLIWENLLSTQYYATPFYPGIDRSIRFGLSWDFWN